jgi:hypothetical protein
MRELQQHMITNEIIKKLEIYRKGNDKNDQAIISNCFWILAILISGQKELKQFAIEHSLIQQILLTMEIFKYFISFSLLL